MSEKIVPITLLTGYLGAGPNSGAIIDEQGYVYTWGISFLNLNFVFYNIIRNFCKLFY